MFGALLKILLVLVTGHVLSACSVVVVGKSTFEGLEVEGKTRTSIAVLDWHDCHSFGIGCSVSVQRQGADGVVDIVPDEKKYHSAKLPPGNYEVRVYSFIESMFPTWGKYGDMKYLALSGSTTFDAGKTYYVNKSLWRADNIKYGSSWWIEESDTRKSVIGSKPPEHLPGFWYNPLYK